MFAKTDFQILTCFENLTDPRIERCRKQKVRNIVAAGWLGCSDVGVNLGKWFAIT
jgi:hypothetical protein